MLSVCTYISDTFNVHLIFHSWPSRLFRLLFSHLHWFVGALSGASAATHFILFIRLSLTLRAQLFNWKLVSKVAPCSNWKCWAKQTLQGQKSESSPLNMLICKWYEMVLCKAQYVLYNIIPRAPCLCIFTFFHHCLQAVHRFPLHLLWILSVLFITALTLTNAGYVTTVYSELNRIHRLNPAVTTRPWTVAGAGGSLVISSSCGVAEPGPNWWWM